MPDVQAPAFTLDHPSPTDPAASPTPDSSAEHPAATAPPPSETPSDPIAAELARLKELTAQQATQLAELRGALMAHAQQQQQQGKTTPPLQSEPRWKQLQVEREKWARLLRSSALTDEQRAEADEQVRLHDREIAYERAKSEILASVKQQTASTFLEQEALSLLSQYQGVLTPNSPLYHDAQQRYLHLLDSGYPDTTVTKALAVAASMVGKSKGVAPPSSSGSTAPLFSNPNKLPPTGGQAPPSPAGRKFSVAELEKMTDEEFRAFERDWLKTLT